jgi:hypothetical protein
MSKKYFSDEDAPQSVIYSRMSMIQLTVFANDRNQNKAGTNVKDTDSSSDIFTCQEPPIPGHFDIYTCVYFPSDIGTSGKIYKKSHHRCFSSPFYRRG